MVATSNWPTAGINLITNSNYRLAQGEGIPNGSGFVFSEMRNVKSYRNYNATLLMHLYENRKCVTSFNSIHKTITSTELSNISTPLQLIAPVSGKIIVVERVVAKMEAQTTAYDFTNGLQITYDTFPDAIASFDNGFTNSILDAYSTVAGGSVPAQPNVGIFLKSSSNPTVGDGILHLKIYYRIIEF